MEAFRNEEDQDEKLKLHRSGARDVLNRLKLSLEWNLFNNFTDNLLMMLLSPAAIEEKFEIVNLKQMAVRRFIVKSR